MWLLVLTIAAAVATVYVTGGSVGELARLRLTAPGFLVCGLAIQAALEFVTFTSSDIHTVGYGLLMLSYALMLAFCLANLRLRGFWLITLGIGLNALVIGLNLGMPTKPIGNDAHGNRVYRPVPLSVKHRQATRDDLLGFLGDKVVLPKPFDTVVSPGDIAIAFGIAWLCYSGSRKRHRISSATDEPTAA